MKRLVQLPIGILILLTFSSCEKVIDVDLDSEDPILVIEAPLQAGVHDFEVSISRSAPYFENGSITRVDNASVTLSDDQGNTYPIPLTSAGLYTQAINAQPNRTYTLTVLVDGQTYQAESYLPPTVELTQVFAEFEPGNAFLDEGYTVYFRYNEPAGIQNFYQVVHYVNGVEQTTGDDLQILNDVLNDGSEARFPLFRKVFDAGDQVLVELRHFDETSYEYFNSLTDIVATDGGPAGGNAAPGNPNTNWSGGILGYFSAYSADTMSVTIR